MKKFFGFTKIIKPTTWSYTERRERERDGVMKLIQMNEQRALNLCVCGYEKKEKQYE
jgi:hypothetical protein